MHVRSLLAGAGLAVVVAGVPIVVVSAASADPGPASTTTSCPLSEIRQEVATFRAAHPEVATERATIRQLPADQRAAAWKQYLAAHPDVATAVAGLRSGLRAQRWEVAGNAATALAGHPELQGLADALASAQVGQRAAAARQYLAAHPDARAALQQVRQEARQACPSGD